MKRFGGRIYSLSERYRVFAAARGGRFRLSVAFGIVLVSILAAVMAWRASVLDERSANTDELSRQDIVRLQQIQASNAETVIEDLRIFARYEEHVLQSLSFKRQGDDARAQEERSLAKALVPFFRASQPIENDDGTPYFDPKFALKVLNANDSELETLRPFEQRAAAKEAHIRGVQLTGLAALFVAALLFLTLGEVTRPGLSRWFAGTGTAVAVTSFVLFLLV